MKNQLGAICLSAAAFAWILWLNGRSLGSGENEWAVVDGFETRKECVVGRTEHIVSWSDRPGGSKIGVNSVLMNDVEFEEGKTDGLLTFYCLPETFDPR